MYGGNGVKLLKISTCIVHCCRSHESLHLSSLISYATVCCFETGFMLIHTVIDLIWRSSALNHIQVGHIRDTNDTASLEFDCRSHESLQTSSLISYATIV